MNTSHKAPRFCVVLIFFSLHQNNKSEPAKKHSQPHGSGPYAVALIPWKRRTLYSSVYPIIHRSLVRREWSFILMSSISSTYDRLMLSLALRRLIPAGNLIVRVCHLMLGRAENKSRNSILVIALPQLMRDDEMKKRGIAENNGDWGSLRLRGLGINHPATPPSPPPLCSHPDAYSTHSYQVEGCFKVFYFSSLRGSLPAGTSQIEFVVLPNIPKWLLWPFIKLFCFFFSSREGL